jgi:hypothetical protein
MQKMCNNLEQYNYKISGGITPEKYRLIQQLLPMYDVRPHAKSHRKLKFKIH